MYNLKKLLLTIMYIIITILWCFIFIFGPYFINPFVYCLLISFFFTVVTISRYKFRRKFWSTFEYASQRFIGELAAFLVIFWLFYARLLVDLAEKFLQNQLSDILIIIYTSLCFFLFFLICFHLRKQLIQKHYLKKKKELRITKYIKNIKKAYDNKHEVMIRFIVKQIKKYMIDFTDNTFNMIAHNLYQKLLTPIGQLKRIYVLFYTGPFYIITILFFIDMYHNNKFFLCRLFLPVLILTMLYKTTLTFLKVMSKDFVKEVYKRKPVSSFFIKKRKPYRILYKQKEIIKETKKSALPKNYTSYTSNIFLRLLNIEDFYHKGTFLDQKGHHDKKITEARNIQTIKTMKNSLKNLVEIERLSLLQQKDILFKIFRPVILIACFCRILIFGGAHVKFSYYYSNIISVILNFINESGNKRYFSAFSNKGEDLVGDFILLKGYYENLDYISTFEKVNNAFFNICNILYPLVTNEQILNNFIETLNTLMGV